MTTQNAQNATPTSNDKMAAIQALISATGFAATPKTKAQESAASTPNGAPGLASGVAGNKAESPSWNYATSSLVNGRAFRTNAAGLHNSLLALSLTGGPSTHTGMAQAVQKAGGRVTTDSMWCGSRDLIDLQFATFTYVGQKKLVQLTEKGADHLISVLQATAAAGFPVWVDHTDGTLVKCDKDNTVLEMTMDQVKDALVAKVGTPDSEGEHDEEPQQEEEQQEEPKVEAEEQPEVEEPKEEEKPKATQKPNRKRR